jgi:predicted amidophosphoribosyltransferase
MISLITEENLRQAQRKEKEENAKKNLLECVSSWDKLSFGLPYSYLFYYYPTTCDFEATEEEWSNRWLIWDFKNTPGKTTEEDHYEALDKAIPMLKNKLITTFGENNLKYLTLVCIPASSQAKTQARYEVFSNRICGETGLINAYSHISVVSERQERHLGGTGMNTGQIAFDEGFFKGKYVLLFDDVVTRGDSMRTFKRKMESLGAIVIGGLSLGKTKHERPIKESISNPFTRPVFPPQPTTISDDDDFPF